MSYQNKKWDGAFQRLMTEAERPVDFATSDQQDEIARERYLTAMRSPAPVNWFSDHLREDQRLRGAVYVAIKVLADQAAAAEVKFHKWAEDARMGGDQDAKEPLPRKHPLVRLLTRPNAHDSKGLLLRRNVQQLCLTGSALNWRVDNGLNVPIELWNVPTGTYQPLPISARYPDGAYRVLPYFPGPLAQVPGIWSAGGVAVDAKNMLAVRLPHPLVYQEGQSPLSACDLALDTIDSIDRARMSTMRRGINPGAVAELDPNVKYPDDAELRRIQQQMFQLVGGPDKAGKLAVLGAGMKLEPWLPNGIEVGWIDSWNQLTGFVLSVFGVTKSLAFMSEDTNYAALYATLKQFNLFSLCPLLDLIADAFNHQLVWPFFGEDVCVSFEPKKIDNEELTELQLANDIKAGIRLNNEIRVLRGLPETDEPWGKERAFADGAAVGGKSPRQPESVDHGSGGSRVEANRPENLNGRGSLPGRLILNGKR